MKQRLIYLLKTSLLWIFFSIINRLIFLLYNYSFTSQLPVKELFFTFTHGLKLDISITGYILFFLLLFMAFIAPFGETINKWVTRVYNIILIVISSVITIVDIELYRNWGFRIDNTILLYLESPKESLASTSIGLFLFLFLLTGLLIWLAFFTYKRFVENSLDNIKSVKWFYIPLFLLISASMIIPIRGGFGIAPINQGTVYFSSHQFANHTALNAPWNFGRSLTTMNRKQNIEFMSDDKALNNFNTLFAKNEKQPKIQVIKEGTPNIVIIILESFTSSVIESLGGLPKVTPQFDRLAKEGVLFTNFYANGDRSDKGIVSILSGYPAQPTTSIIKYIKKTEKLPFLSNELEKEDYSTGFYYGGEINFANMNSYFVSGGYDTLVSLDSYSKSELNSKWGAHDHVTFNKFFNDLEKTKSPFFRTMFTLSSHEPFDVPHKSQFNGSDDDSKFLNSVHYTDSCLGDFIQKAKQTDWWDNTWFILVADHGSRLPGNISYSSSAKFKIPMLWLGGAVITDTIISKTTSQIDIPLMIGNQLDMEFENFNFSKDVLSNEKGFAFFAFNNGFGFYNDSTGFVWDNTANNFIINEDATLKIEHQGKAFMQMLLNDFNRK